MIADHLGNTRARFVDKNKDEKITATEDATPEEYELIGSYHYYPFGMAMEGTFSEHQGVKNKYQYNGIEHMDFIGHGISLTTFRVHDAAVGRWWQVDPKAEATIRLSPFVAMGDNPILHNDPNGDIIPALVLGAAWSVVGNGISNVAQGNNFYAGAGQAALFGAVSAGVSYGIGSTFGSVGSAGNEIARAGAHALANGAMSSLQGGSFAQGTLSGGFSSIAGSALNGTTGVGAYVAGGVAGGIGSLLGGGNIWHGTGQGLLVTALNHQSHTDPPSCADCTFSMNLSEITITASRPLGPTVAAAAAMGASFTGAAAVQAGKGYWLGKNFKYNSPTWTGNGATGGRSVALASSRFLKYGGTALGVPSVLYNGSEALNAFNVGNKRAGSRALAETVSSGIGLAGVPGMGWTAGWEIGRGISKNPFYNRRVFGEAGRDGLLSTPNR